MKMISSPIAKPTFVLDAQHVMRFVRGIRRYIAHAVATPSHGRYNHFHAPQYISSSVILHTEQTEGHENDFTAHS